MTVWLVVARQVRVARDTGWKMRLLAATLSVQGDTCLAHVAKVEAHLNP
jgi:hypothetical protein